MTDDLSRHQQRFEADPDATGSFVLLEGAAIANRRWEALAHLYRHRATAPSLARNPAGRAQLALALGRLQEEQLEDPDGALQSYGEVVRLDPSQRPAWIGMRRLYTARQSWGAVLQVAEAEAGTLDDPAERAGLFEEMGEIWRSQLGDPEQAEQFDRRARAERPAAPQAPAAAAPEPAGESPEEHHAELVQEAWISAARGDSDRAVSLLREALDGDPSNVEAVDMLVTVLDGAERHAELAELLERRAVLAPDPTTRAAVLSRLGQVQETQLGDMSAARSAYERALEADPRSQAARSELTRIYRLTECWNELRSLLESVRAEGPPDQRVPVLCQLGLLLERQFDEAPAAIAHFEQALELEPDNPDARAGLERLRDAAASSDTEDEAAQGGENRAVRIVGVLERKLQRLDSEGLGTDEDGTRLRIRLAELRSAKLDDPVGAIQVLEPCLDDEDALGMVAPQLAQLYERTGRQQALIRLARRAAASAQDPGERAEWYRRAAETARGIGEVESAIELFGRLLQERPTDRHAERTLIALHRTRGDAAPLARLLRHELARASAGDEFPIHLELAQVLSEALGDDLGALAHWRRALTLDPAQDHLLEDALRCANATGGALHQLELLDHAVGATLDPLVRARLLLRRGDVLGRGLGWIDEAVESWKNSLAIDPDQPEVRSRLESVRGAAAASPA